MMQFCTIKRNIVAQMSIFVQHSKKNKPSKPKKDTFRNIYGSVSTSGIRRTSYHFQTAEPKGETTNELEGETKKELKGETKEETIVSPDSEKKEELNKILEQETIVLSDLEEKEELNKILKQVHAQRGKTKWILGNVGGKIERVDAGKVDGPFTFVGGTNFGPYAAPDEAAAATRCKKGGIRDNIKNIKNHKITQIELPSNLKKIFIIENDHGIVLCKEVKVEEGTFTFTFAKYVLDLGPYKTVEDAAAGTGLTETEIRKNITNNSRPITKSGPYKTEKEAAAVTGLTETEIRENIVKKKNNLSVKFRFIYPDPRTLGRHLMVQKRYSFVKEMIKNNIASDTRHNAKKTLVAMIEGIKDLKGLYLASKNIGGAAKKYNFTAEQILDSINKPLPIVAKTDENGKFVKDITHKHKTKDNKGIQRTKIIRLTGKNVTFSWKVLIPLSKKAKKVLKATDGDKQHQLAFQICKYMIDNGMFASKNVIDDNRGLIENGFKFRVHGGLFNVSLDRKVDNANGEYKLHYPELGDALENIHVVALMTNVRYKASKDDRIEWRADFQEKSEVLKKVLWESVFWKKKKKSALEKESKKKDEHPKESFKFYPTEEYKKEFNDRIEESKKATYNGGINTPLYGHASVMWTKDKKCHGRFGSAQAYWDFLKALLEEQKGICAVGRYPMTLESGARQMSPDAIDPLKGHVPKNVRLVCFCNNPTDTSKTDNCNTSAENKLPTSLTRKIHDTYWGMLSDDEAIDGDG